MQTTNSLGCHHQPWVSLLPSIPITKLQVIGELGSLMSCGYTVQYAVYNTLSRVTLV